MIEFVDLFVKAGEGAQQAAPSGGIVTMLIPFGIMFVIFYFLLIRPQKKSQQKHQELILNLKKGDKVLTMSGIIGTIFSVEDKFFVLDIAEKTKIKIIKSQIATKYEE